MDNVLEALYNSERSAGLAVLAKVARWLGDIRSYFPSSTGAYHAAGALQRLHLTQMLLERRC